MVEQVFVMQADGLRHDDPGGTSDEPVLSSKGTRSWSGWRTRDVPLSPVPRPTLACFVPPTTRLLYIRRHAMNRSWELSDKVSSIRRQPGSTYKSHVCRD